MVSKNDEKLDDRIRRVMKEQERKEMLSPFVLLLTGYFIAITIPQVLAWLGMGDSFFASTEFIGIASLIFIIGMIANEVSVAAKREKGKR